MDPLSQERPKPLGDGIGLFIGMYEGVKTSAMDKKRILKDLQTLLAEVKRLQTIDQHAIKRLKAEIRGNSELAAERDRYREALKLAMSENQNPTIYKGVQKILKGDGKDE